MSWPKEVMKAFGVDVDEMDITDRAAVERVIGEVHPDKVVHCAAWTAVDAAEDNQEVLPQSQCRRYGKYCQNVWKT